MTAFILRADAHAGARDVARADLLERRLRRFQPRFQPRVRALAERHARLKDLAASFPALLFALAVPRAGFDPTPAIAQVIDGAGLREIAAAARVSFWVRRFGPEAFGAPIPELPDSELFRRRIGSLAPKSPKDVTSWLRAVAVAADWGDEAIALWAARVWTSRSKRYPRQLEDQLAQLCRICVWAWHSKNGMKDAPCHPRTRWTPCMTWQSANAAKWEWWTHVRLHMSLSGTPLEDAWLQPASIDGYEFVPLRSASEIMDAGRTLKNCGWTYGDRLAHNSCRLWGMHRGGELFAMLELSHARQDPLPSIVQLQLAKNARAPLEAWLVARKWLAAHDLRAAAKQRVAWGEAPLDRKTWQALWKPFWLAKKRIPDWLPLTPTWSSLREV